MVSLILSCPPLSVLTKHQVWPPCWAPGAGSRLGQRLGIILDRSHPNELPRCCWCRASPRGSEDSPHRSPTTSFTTAEKLSAFTPSAECASPEPSWRRHEQKQDSEAFAQLLSVVGVSPSGSWGPCALCPGSAPFLQGC